MKYEPVIIIASIIGFFVLYVLCRIFIRPIKWLLRLLCSCCMGVLAMWAVSQLIKPLGLAFAINPLTAMISGVLGIPGMIVTLVLQQFL